QRAFCIVVSELFHQLFSINFSDRNHIFQGESTKLFFVEAMSFKQPLLLWVILSGTKVHTVRHDNTFGYHTLPVLVLHLVRYTEA
ncbi:MAG: hypothetical protein ACRC5T_09955, partial [Cetobacterium sp.]